MEPQGYGNPFHEVIKMVKGISRQVILVRSPDPKLFEQAIFILREDAVGQEGVTDDALLKEARRLISGPGEGKKRKLSMYGAAWACAGALLTGAVWLLTALI